MYLNFGWVASFVTKETNSIVCGSSIMALYKSFSLRSVWTMLSTGVTLHMKHNKWFNRFFISIIFLMLLTELFSNQQPLHTCQCLDIGSQLYRCTIERKAKSHLLGVDVSEIDNYQLGVA